MANTTCRQINEDSVMATARQRVRDAILSKQDEMATARRGEQRALKAIARISQDTQYKEKKKRHTAAPSSAALRPAGETKLTEKRKHTYVLNLL